MQRIFSSFIHAQERASRLTPNYPQIFSLFFRHYRYQAARVAEESFRAHSRRCSNGQTRTTAAAQHRTGGRRRGAAFSIPRPVRAATARRRAGASVGGRRRPRAALAKPRARGRESGGRRDHRAARAPAPDCAFGAQAPRGAEREKPACEARFAKPLHRPLPSSGNLRTFSAPAPFSKAAAERAAHCTCDWTARRGRGWRRARVAPAKPRCTCPGVRRARRARPAARACPWDAQNGDSVKAQSQDLQAKLIPSRVATRRM